MNITNIEKMAEFFDTLQADLYRQDRYGQWVNGVCHSPGCIAGWTVAVVGDPMEAQTYTDPMSYAATLLFGEDGEYPDEYVGQVDDLFQPWPEGPGVVPPAPVKAAQVLRDLIQTGEVHW